MKPEYVPPTEIGKQRHVCFKAHAKSRMTMDEYLSLNEEALRQFPISEEERQLKSENLMPMPEFVL